MREIRAFFVIGVILVCSGIVWGAGGAETGGDAAFTRVAYVINGGLGDQSFFDSGQSGMDRIAQMSAVETTTIEINYDPAKYVQAMDAAVQWRADVVFVISYGLEDLVQQYASDNPDIIFVNVDTVVQNAEGNITSIDFIEEEGAFMAGAAAALLTTDINISGVNAEKRIGSVGGEDDPVINAFIFGYTKGAQHIDPEIQVENIYAGVWDDPVRGKQAAKQLYSQGIDVIFQIAALTGNGVLEAAREEGLYAIGVDSNQNGLQPGHVVTSDLKNVGDAIYETYLSIVNGAFERGEILQYGLANGGVGLAIDEHTRAILPEESINRLMQLAQQIIAGEVAVPRFQE